MESRAPALNASVLFPFSGVPARTSGSIPTQFFSITPAQVSALFWVSQLLLVHEPSAFAFFAMLVWNFRRMRRLQRAQSGARNCSSCLDT